MRLSPHFTLAEFTRSDKAIELGEPNQPTRAHLSNLQRLAAGMEKVRAICGDRPITITSAYRNPKVNRAVGGVPTSAHALGHAADFTVAGLTPMAAARMIRDSALGFDQLILETGRGIVHLSFDPRGRREVKTQRDGPGTAVKWGLNP